MSYHYSTRLRSSLFTHLDDPNLDGLNALQRAVYNRRTDKARRLIAASSDHNIYEHCALSGMNLLFLALARDHIALADDILAIYEQDFRTVERFYAAAKTEEDANDNYAWVRDPILVACGAAKVAEARRLCTDLDCTRSNNPIRPTGNANDDGRYRSGLLVLCKQSNADAEADVIWCTVRSAADVPKFARLIRALYAAGCLRFHDTSHDAMLMASLRNHFEQYVRIVDLWGRHAVHSPETYMENLLEFCSHRAAGADAVTYFVELLRKFGPQRFPFVETTNADDDDDGGLPLRLSERRAVRIYPLGILRSTTYGMLEWILRLQAEQRQRAEGGTMQANLRYVFEHPEESDDFVCGCLDDDALVPELVQMLALCKPDLLSRSPDDDDDLTRPILLDLIRRRPAKDATTRTTIVRWIVERYEEMHANDPLLLRDIVVALVEWNWSDGLRALYGTFPGTVKQYFLHDERREDNQRLMDNIAQRHFGIVEFLLDEHREQFSTAELVGDLIVCCASGRRSAGLLEMCLRLPGAALAIGGKGNGLFAALNCRQPANYRRILETVDAELVRSVREEHSGDSLLHAAIWYKGNVVNEDDCWDAFETDGEADEPLVDLEVVDSDDDEATAEQKRQHNIDQFNRKNNNVDDEATTDDLPDEYYAQEEADYGVRFQELIDAGCDVHAVNVAGETLIHDAVRYDNLSVLDKLLALGVDPLRADAAGTVPVYLCESLAVLQRLLACDGVREQTAGVDAAGQTALHRYVVSNAWKGATDAEAAAYVEVLLAAGVDVHAKCNALQEDGDTALHLAVRRDARNVLAALLAGGADVNARNAIGETPLHHMFDNGEVIRLADDDQIDWLATSDAGVSILPALLRLGANETDRLAAVFDKHTDALRTLFAEHSTAPPDEYGRQALDDLTRNASWTRRFVGGLGDGVDAHRMRVNFVTADATERILAKWMIARGVNFAYLAAPGVSDGSFQFSTTAGWNMLFELGALVRFDAVGRANALQKDRLRRDYHSKDAVETIAHLVLSGADLGPLYADNWPDENVWVYDSLMSWYQREHGEEKHANADAEPADDGGFGGSEMKIETNIGLC